MNLYNGNEDEKKDAAPMLGRASSPFKRNSTFGRTPMLSRAAGGILERLKNLSRKDMAFVGVGLSVLVMAPVAEYMMSKPSTDNMLASGFGSRNGSTAGGGLYEPGINALSQGSADGNGEVITPLSSRDPASLILGAQTAQPMVASAPPPDTSMRDAVRDSGRAAFSEAVKSAGAPTPIPRMSAAMRSSMFGSSGETRTAGSLSGKAIIDDAKSASSKAAKRSMVGPVAPAGYKGVSNNTPNSASKNALDKLRAQGDKAASNFSDASASRGLDNAAAQAINADANGGSGAGSSGVGSKNPSNSTNKNSHSNQGECKTLACEAEKKRQEKALEWEFFKKYEIPKQIINAVVSGFTSSLTKFVTGITDKLTGQGGGGAATYVCLGKLVETTPCFPPKPAGGGAAPVNVTELDRSSDEKEVGAWTVGDGKICPCGKKNADAYDALGKAADGKDNTVKPSVEPGLTPEAAAALVTAKFADYDNELKLMLLAAKEGAETDNPGQLIKDTKAIADSFPRLRANELAAAIKAKAIAEKTGSGSIAAYAANINSAQMELNTIRSEYEIFKRKLDNVAKAAEAGKLKVGISGTGGITYSVASSEFLPYIRTAKTSMEKDQSPYSMIDEVNAQLAVNDSKKEAYIAHIGFASDGTDQVTEEYTAALAEAQRVSKDMSTTPLTIDIVRADFEKLTGFKPAVPGSGASAKLGPDALAFNTSGITDFRDQAASPSVPLLNSAKMWRGLNIEKPFGKDKANDTEAIAAEIKSWKAVTPRDKTADITSDNNLAKKNLLAEYMRGLGEVPADAKHNKLDPSAEVTTLADVRTQIEKIRKQLVDTWKINMDNPAGDKESVDQDDHTPTPNPIDNNSAGKELAAIRTEATGIANNYGTGPNRIQYKDWPKNLPRTGIYATSSTEYKRATGEINKTRKEVDQLAAKLAEKSEPPMTAAEAQKIVDEMKLKGQKIDQEIVKANASLAEAKRLQKASNTGGGTNGGNHGGTTPSHGGNTPVNSASVADTLPRGALQKIGFTEQTTWIPAYDKNDKPVWGTYCDGTLISHWYKSDDCVRGGMTAAQMKDFKAVFANASKIRLTNSGTWTKAHVMVKVPDYAMVYSGNSILQAYPTRMSPPQATPSADVTEMYKNDSVKEGKYDMSVFISCDYSQNSKRWIISKATLRKGEAQSSNTWGASATVGGDIGVVKVSGTVSYAHSWGTFNYGKTWKFDNMKQQICTASGK